MYPDSALITFEQDGSRILAWTSPMSFAPVDNSSAQKNHGYDYLTTPLRQRGLECTVEFGLSDYIVHAELPDGSSLIISPPQEPPSDHPEGPESWTVTRRRDTGPAVYEVIYDSGPEGLHAWNGGSVPHLLAVVDARLDRLGVAPRREQERSAEEQAADTVLYRAGFVPAVAFGGVHYHRLPSAMTDPAEQRLAVARALHMLQAEGFHVVCDPSLAVAGLPRPQGHEMSLGDRLGRLAQSVRGATHTSEAVAALSELTAPGDGVLQRVIEVLDTTADWWEGMGGTADRRYADRLRLIAEDLDSCTGRLQSIRNDLADRHVPHPEKAQAAQAVLGTGECRARTLAVGRTPHGPGRPADGTVRAHRATACAPLVRSRPLTAFPYRSPPVPRTSRTVPAPDHPCLRARPEWIRHAHPDQEPLPDVVVGHHPDYGIVAANPKNLPASTWMLKRLDFHPVPGEPNLYVLADPQRDGADRAARAVMLLRNADLRVDVDAAFDLSLADGVAPGRDRAALGEPAVAFAEHPRLGIVAAIDSRASGLTGLALVEHGWRHNPRLDIYALPATTGRDEALGKVAGATVALHRSGVQVAVQPHLAQDVAARRRPAPRTSRAP